jgi:deazaflavin-dependent oxidoreductase (nitroreductase family)
VSSRPSEASDPGSDDGAPGSADPVGDDLVAWGRAARLETRGRRTGLRRRVVVGFVEAPGGALLVAAGPDAAWGWNLRANPVCRITIGARSWDVRARELFDTEFAHAVRELILRGGTPAEGLGHGPAFRLERLEPAVAAARLGPNEPAPPIDSVGPAAAAARRPRRGG